MTVFFHSLGRNWKSAVIALNFVLVLFFSAGHYPKLQELISILGLVGILLYGFYRLIRPGYFRSLLQTLPQSLSLLTVIISIIVGSGVCITLIPVATGSFSIQRTAVDIVQSLYVPIFYILFTLLAVSSGIRLLRWADIAIQHEMMRLTIGLAIGIGVLMVVYYVLALLGLVYTISLPLVALAAATFSFRELRYLIKRARIRIPVRIIAQDPLYALGGGTLIVIFGCAYLIAVAQSAAFSFDTYAFYLDIPKRILETHGLTVYQHRELANASIGSHYILLPLMIAGGAILDAASLYFFSVTCAATLCISRLAAQSTRESFFAIFLLSTPVLNVSYFLLRIRTDYLMIFFVLAGFAMLLMWEKNLLARYLLVASFFAGAAVAIKYNALFFVIPLFAVWIFGSRKQRFKYALYAAFATLGAYSIWGVRSLLQFGDLFYPYIFFKFYRHASPPDISALSDLHFAAYQTNLYGIGPLFSPFKNFFLILTNGLSGMNINVAFGGFLTAVILFFKSDPFYLRLLIATLGSVVLWYLSAPSSIWYALGALPLCALLYAHYISQIASRLRSILVGIVAMIAIAVLPFYAIQAIGATKPHQQVREVYKEASSFVEAMVSDGKPFTVLQYRPAQLPLYFFPPMQSRYEVSWEVPYYPAYLLALGPDAFRLFLKAQGITHIYYAETILEFRVALCRETLKNCDLLTKETVYMKEMLQSLPPVLSVYPYYTLYEVK